MFDVTLTDIIKYLVISSACFKFALSHHSRFVPEDVENWKRLGQQDIEDALRNTNNNGIAKNVILFVGDGMGPSTVTASRIYGSKEGGYLSFEKFPNMAMLKTYCADKLVPDSSSTATALFSGAKVNFHMSGLDASVSFDDCTASLEESHRIKGIATWAQAAQKSTGFVTTTRVTHATPAGFYAHIPNRKWECEATIPENSNKCKDVARQLIEDEPGINFQVIMGGGRQGLMSNPIGTNDDPLDTWSCIRKDGKNLIKDWEKHKKSKNASYKFVSNRKELDNLDISTDYVLGVFSNSHLKYNYSLKQSDTEMPSLTSMTSKAIQILQKNEKGFLLMVEGGLIDFSHHRGHAKIALDETVEFSKAIQAAVDLTESSKSETLIIVTSDHDHSLVFTGYADRTTNILDIAQNSNADDKIPYTSLLYGTGGDDNYQFTVNDSKVQRRNPELDDTQSFEYFQQAVVRTDEVTHSGTDVAVYATGPMAHLFTSVHEQSYVAYVIAYAAKIGPYHSGSSSLTLLGSIIVFNICILFTVN